MYGRRGQAGRSPFTKTQQAAYIFLGFLAPLTGSVLGIVFVAMHGSKFGPRAVPVMNYTLHKLELHDGPPEFYLVSFWMLACFQVVVLLLNFVGPCSCETRSHFSVQLAGVVADFVYLVMVGPLNPRSPNRERTCT